MTAPKRQKIEDQVKEEVSEKLAERTYMFETPLTACSPSQNQPQQQQHLGVSASPLRVPSGLIHPAMNPLFNPQASPQPSIQPSLQPAQQPTQTGIPQQIFLAALKRNNALYPVAPKTNPIGSRRIDAIAHSMWDVVFAREAMMTEVTMKAALFAPLKLRALARLNWLPSWWFLREMAVTLMKQQGWLVDDSERQGEWREAVEWCKKAETKCFGAGAGTGAATQDGGLSAVQIQELKQAAAAAATRKVGS